ncbi:hypothetical protein [Roseobacter weihaiensis]|uniref:hypothetical protein n=1 Tax=Roseobacter weihaiensis TaxID=2763262 RepID=UPI001D09B92C|nr:hypothetical protein [Roseobacter sp. H9]
MKRAAALLLCLAALTACGVDGEPIRPTLAGAVTIGDGGISPSVGVGVSQGPLSVFLGL